ncbi:hypothetical protein TTHERM_00131090 (macronuclear) [Tetrahymena thermophila SB210]|uniref:Uncharacterized protein n=1 Tax=Tetrahymena thermophila (strain SB210) TaxID=312017 RepID=I7M253_TETTS|nr:hypothetical protein TTHERM_00131090 [Tetrahymena thermophila SB210]EAR99341.2 hypothetical protein TTHERM_00131090 [Tetrahymena thermophila SB210]|eukprot:XP_001019586.2 hypothetical protein TTHERM_00131090 [Tetrahymena thermophila SB210]
MGGGSSKNKKGDKNKKGQNGVKSQDALEVKNQEQLEKEHQELEKQKKQQNDEQDKMNFFIANNEQLENNPKLTSPLKPGEKNLTLMQIEEQAIIKDSKKQKLQDSLHVNASPLKPIQQDSLLQKDSPQKPPQLQQQRASLSNFKNNNQQNIKQQTEQKQSKQNLKRNDDLSFDLSREMQPYVQNNSKKPEFQCDISAIYSDDEKETPQQQAQRIFKKIQQVAEINKLQTANDKMRFFNWPNSGECKIMSVNFKIIYSHKDQDLKLIKSYNYHTASTLQWQKNAQLKSYDFVMQDNLIFDAHNASSTHLENNIISFVVAENGDFVCIKDEQTFVNNVRKNQTIINSRMNSTNNNEQSSIPQRRARQSVAKNQKIEKNKVISETENQMKQMWQQSITEFLEKENSQFEKENQNSQKSNFNKNNQEDDDDDDEKQRPYKAEKKIVNCNITHNGFNCQLIQKIDIQPREKIENFLKENLLKDEKFYNFCFKNPKMTIRDKLKQWDVVNEQEDIELIPKKFRFPVLRKHQITSGIIEEKNQFIRPHTITTDNCKIVVIDHKRDLFVDVGQELKLLVFLWPERGDNQNEIHFYEELSKFKDLCDDALKSMVLDLSRVRSLPLSYRPKLKKKYFELY